MPAGTRLLPEYERLETLNDLKEAKTTTNNQLERLPVVSKTLKMTRHRQDIEEKLVRLEKAIDIFSKEQVYVQV